MLFHKDVGYPEPVTQTLAKFEGKPYRLDYTGHARRAAQLDRYDKIDLPNRVNFANCEAVEVEVRDKRIHKVVYRTRYNQQFDLILVIVMETLRVKTVWLNEREDAHATLDTTRFIRPEMAAL
jgi:hypothetical protein